MTARVLRHRETDLPVTAHFAEGRVTLTSAGSSRPRVFEAAPLGGGEWLLDDGAGQHVVLAARQGDTWWVHCGGRTWVLEAVTRRAGDERGGSLEAPMTGTLLSVLVAPGDVVRRGQPLVVMSAMKMQVEIKAPADGVVKAVPHAAGDQVEGGTPLVVLERPPA